MTARNGSDLWFEVICGLYNDNAAVTTSTDCDDTVWEAINLLSVRARKAIHRYCGFYFKTIPHELAVDCLREVHPEKFMGLKHVGVTTYLEVCEFMQQKFDIEWPHWKVVNKYLSRR